MDDPNNFLCTLEASTIYPITAINDDLWNFGRPAGAGVIGLWWDSPVWEQIVNCPTPNYTISMSNLSDYSFADANYTHANNVSAITLC